VGLQDERRKKLGVQGLNRRGADIRVKEWLYLGIEEHKYRSD
jgi:hypothetical protein